MRQERFVVPSIYEDRSDRWRGYFQFSFRCPACGYRVETSSQHSNTAIFARAMDIVALETVRGWLGALWVWGGEGDRVLGSRWQREHDQALITAWEEIQNEYRHCNRCQRTVCVNCWNPQVNLCVVCAPDLKADAAQYQHQLNVGEQRKQLEVYYQAPQFNIGAVPSAVTADMLKPPQEGAAPQVASRQGKPQALPGQGGAPLPLQAPSAAGLASVSTPGTAQLVPCPNCHLAGSPGTFCQNCGAQLPMPGPLCPKCAAPVSATAHFCPACGERLER